MSIEEYINRKISSLSKSKFRGSFHLNNAMKEYVLKNGMQKIESHAYDFINKRIKPSNPTNDGRQTQMKGHPVFIAQHACGFCCRGCIEKIHKIPRGRELTNEEVDYIVKFIKKWIEIEINE